MKPSTPPLDTLWQASALIWVVLAGEGLAVILSLAPGIPDNRWIYFGLSSLMTQWVLLTTLGLLYLARRRLATLRPQYIAYLALLILLLATWLMFGLAWLLLADLWMVRGAELHGAFLRFTGIALTVGLLGLAAFQNHWRTRQLAVKAKQAELEALQARIRPHFLFNTLNTGAALVHQRPADAEQLLLDLADLFRAALTGPRDIALEDELALTRRYLEIESLRFGPRLRIHWQLPEQIPQVSLPSLSIQPLVENAIRHGVEPNPEGAQVQIQISQDKHWIRIEVRNPLPGSPAVTPGHQVGLNAVRARLLALAGDPGQLELSQRDGEYIATIRLPIPA